MGLMVASIAINCIDRGTLSIAAVALSGELHLQPHEVGFLLSAFFWTYAGAVCSAPSVGHQRIGAGASFAMDSAGGRF
jgi:ACS family D-galactonate transporter-like MFS transporter